jgi:hypothetical protein
MSHQKLLRATGFSVGWTGSCEANPDTEYGKAVRQYCSHVAYYAATRLTSVRVWEDIEAFAGVWPPKALWALTGPTGPLQVF